MMAPEFTIKYLRFFMLSSLFSLVLVGVLLKFQVFGASEGGFVFESGGEPLKNGILYSFLGVSGLITLIQFKLSTATSLVSREVVRLALCESIGILGFVFFLFSGDVRWSLIFVAWSAVLMIAGNRSTQVV